jgi:hypothetical protein
MLMALGHGAARAQWRPSSTCTSWLAGQASAHLQEDLVGHLRHISI